MEPIRPAKAKLVDPDKSASKSVPAIRLAPVDVTAFVDTFAQGPFDEPVPVNSWREFQMLFGGFSATSEASYAVYLYFENGGEFAWIVRVPDPAESGLAVMGSGGERQASPGSLADSLIGGAESRTGMHALRSLTRKRPAVLAVPRAAELGSHGARVYYEALSMAKDLGMVLLIDPPLLADSPAELTEWLHNNPDLLSGHAALYFPRLFFPDALQHGRNRSFGPSGAVAGLLSWLDQERGVWQAPAGLHAALEAVTPTRELLAEDFGPLTQRGVNTIRDFPGHGVVLWGARTLGSGNTGDAEWKYLPIRRFVLSIERSLNQDLDWVVFEPNDEPLWAKVREAVGSFLNGLWRQGAMQGSKPEQAYFVRCDRSTMTQADIDEGRLIVEVGVAPVKPAEFVIVRIQQKTATAKAGSGDDC